MSILITRHPPGLNEVPVGATIRFVCEARVGDRPFSYNWISPLGELLATSSSEISVTFTGNETYGNYTCVAVNSFGMNNRTFLVVAPGIVLHNVAIP